jgi:Xaa-Pro dipeptidase
MTENEACARFLGRAFELGAEFAECRLLSSGPRTNPWFREAGDRPMERGDLVAFDTDLIGPAGYLADPSRTYLVGSTKPSATAEALRRRPGLPRRDHRRAEVGSRPRRGRGATEPPAARCSPRGAVPLHRTWQRPQRRVPGHHLLRFSDHHAGEIEAGMVFSVEACVGVEGEDEGLKLKEQVLVTSAAVEVLSSAPRDERLACS